VVMAGLGHYPNEEDTAGFLAIANPFLKRAWHAARWCRFAACAPALGI